MHFLERSALFCIRFAALPRCFPYFRMCTPRVAIEPLTVLLIQLAARSPELISRQMDNDRKLARKRNPPAWLAGRYRLPGRFHRACGPSRFFQYIAGFRGSGRMIVLIDLTPQCPAWRPKCRTADLAEEQTERLVRLAKCLPCAENSAGRQYNNEST